MVFWGSLGLKIIGFEIPLIRELSGLMILLFIPGFIILRILKIHDNGNLETLLYSIGLSITIIIILGFIINLTLPLLGISNPISFIPIMTTINVLLFILLIFGYFRDNEYCNESNVDFKPFLSPKFLAVTLIIFIAIFGTILINLGIYTQNVPKLILILIIGLIFVFVSFKNCLDNKLYPYIILISAISLVLSTTLISNNLAGFDVQNELYLSTLVLKNSLWNYKLYSNTNAMLSIVMLAPILSIVTKINLTWIFKIIYPLIFSLISIGIYQIVKLQTNSRIAFLSAFFFISLYSFYTEMTYLARQQIAELFLVLIVLLLVENKLSQGKKTLLFLLFTFSLVVSHYGISYLYLIVFGVFALVLYLSNTKLSTYLPGLVNQNKFNQKFVRNSINFNYILLFFTFVFAWYLYVSGSSPLNSMLNIGNQISRYIFSDFLNPNSVQALGIVLAAKPTLLRQVFKVIYYVIPFMIIFGVLSAVIKSNFYKIKRDFKILGIGNLFLLILSISIAGFSSALNTSRIYQISLIILSPFFVLGFLDFLNRLNLKNIRFFNYNTSIKIVSIFCIIFFLFSSGFIYELTNDQPSLITLNSNIDWPIFSDNDVYGAKWLSIEKVNNTVYADVNRIILWVRFEDNGQPIDMLDNKFEINRNSYIYLGSYNIKNKDILITDYENSSIETRYVDFNPLITNKNEIYNNGGFLVFN
jgi:uncharacterized membrane protein